MMKRSLNEYATVTLKSEDLSGKIDFAQLFGRSAPVHVEVGSGKGTFLLHEAQARPDVDFLGIEWARKFHLFAVDRLGRWGLRNVRIIRTEAVTFLADFIPSQSIDCFHIYFPDPWPKKRHHKRRLLQQSNMTIMIRCLKPFGEIRIATDHNEYFQQIEELAGAFKGDLEPVEFTRPAGAQEGELTGTNYERKYIKDKRSIHTLALRKQF
jgi:tRNA (guanine-N7-)-methyltransferase